MKKSFYEYSQNENSGGKFENKTKEANSQSLGGQNTANQTQGFSKRFNQGSGFKNQIPNSGNQTGFNNQRTGFKNQTDFNKHNQNTETFKHEQIENTINKYKNMSQNELLSSLYSEVAKQKSQGTFDPLKLENAISSLGGFLTPEQQKNMKELLRKFK